MTDLVITGASRGIGRALALNLAAQLRPDDRLVLLGRDVRRLEATRDAATQAGGRVLTLVGDLGSIAGARALGEQLAAVVGSGGTLVHNAGVWPTRLARTSDGLEG